jgi:prepilin-type N-terminal cleavage/methylation domain-containing protein
MKQIYSKKKQAGFNLIELMIAIGIILALVGLALGIAPIVRGDQKTSEVQQQVAQIAAQTQALGKGKYTGITAKTLLDAGKVPASWGNADKSGLLHSDGGAVTIAAAAVNGGTDNGAAITLTGVSKSSCVSVLSNSQDNFAVIATDVVPAAKAYGGASITPAAIVTACTPASGSVVDLTQTVV